MELKIDKFGRVVLPKKLREHLGVGLSLKVKVTETPGGALLEPVTRESRLIRKDGLLIFDGTGPTIRSADVRRLIEEDREDRIQHILNP